MKTLKQEYLLADTLEERRIIAIRAANISWARKHKGFPTKEFLEEFLEASFQYEKHKLQRMKLQHITQKIAKEEELMHVEAEKYWGDKFVALLEALEGI